jgi:hypothetical protein
LNVLVSFFHHNRNFYQNWIRLTNIFKHTHRNEQNTTKHSYLGVVEFHTINHYLYPILSMPKNFLVSVKKGQYHNHKKKIKMRETPNSSWRKKKKFYSYFHEYLNNLFSSTFRFNSTIFDFLSFFKKIAK